jgi:hypothetical protein
LDADDWLVVEWRPTAGETELSFLFLVVSDWLFDSFCFVVDRSTGGALDCVDELLIADGPEDGITAAKVSVFVPSVCLVGGRGVLNCPLGPTDSPGVDGEGTVEVLTGLLRSRLEPELEPWPWELDDLCFFSRFLSR